MICLAANTLWDFEFLVEYSENDVWKHPTANEHFHQVYEIYYLVKNEVNYFIGNRSINIKEGSVVIVPPNVIHTTRSLNSHKRKRYLIYIPETFISDFLRDEPDLLKKLEIDPFVIKPADRQHVEKMFYNLLNEYQSKDSSIVMQKSLLGELLVTLYRLSLDDKTSTLSADFNKSPKQILALTNYINSNYNQDITLDSLSKEFFLHPAYISRVFKKQLNINFSNYLKSVRIREATMLIKNSNLEISEIAERTGFATAGAFTRAFKSSTGVTPLQYRKIYK